MGRAVMSNTGFTSLNFEKTISEAERELNCGSRRRCDLCAACRASAESASADEQNGQPHNPNDDAQAEHARRASDRRRYSLNG